MLYRKSLFFFWLFNVNELRKFELKVFKKFGNKGASVEQIYKIDETPAYIFDNKKIFANYVSKSKHYKKDVLTGKYTIDKDELNNFYNKVYIGIIINLILITFIIFTVIKILIN